MAEPLHMTTKSFREIYTGDGSGQERRTRDYLYNNVGNGAAGYDFTQQQIDSWKYEVDQLYDQLDTEEGYLVFEYTIPRINIRPDVIFLYRGIVFVLEFKVHRENPNVTPEPSPAEMRQATTYAHKLKAIHNKSHDHIVVPILVVVNGMANAQAPCLNATSGVYQLLVINESQIFSTIKQIAEKENGVEDLEWNASWVKGRYNPAPGIIEAMLDRFMNHNVADIRESGATYGELELSTNFITEQIKLAEKNKEKVIFFVTGVPGAGKTLVGLNVVANMLKEDPRTHRRHGATYLSGNDSLVKVMKKALKKDADENFQSATDDPEQVRVINDYDTMINLIHTFRAEIVKKLDRNVGPGNQIRFLPGEEDFSVSENVVVFDEAQRAWTHDEISRVGRDNRITALQSPNFTYSEPGFLIWSMAQNHEWAAIVCLVGGGQSINHGEANMTAWMEALRDHFPDWKVYLPVIAKEDRNKYSNLDFLGEVDGLKESQRRYLRANGLSGESNTIESDSLHLKTSRRATHADVDKFIEALLAGDKHRATESYDRLKTSFKLVRTRRISYAKKWLRMMRDQSRNVKERAGFVLSSRAERLRPEGYIAYKQNHYSKVADWFLAPRENVNSSDFLEIALSEFFVQGLELDWVGLLWDGDFRPVTPGVRRETNIRDAWEYYGGFNGVSWTRNNQAQNQDYHLNAYRVLLSRARKGMIIVVPEGDETGADPSRSPAIYNQINSFLEDIGVEEYNGQ